MQRVKSFYLWFALIMLVGVAAILLPTYVFAEWPLTQSPGEPSMQFRCTDPAPYSGVIISIDAQHKKAQLSHPQAQNPAEVSIILSTEATTRIYLQQGNTCKEVSFATLQPGQTLKLWSRLPVIEIYPTPITASEIVIVQ